MEAKTRRVYDVFEETDLGIQVLASAVLARREDLSSTSASRVLLRGSSESAVTLSATCAALDFWSRELVRFRGDTGGLETAVRTGPRGERRALSVF